MLDDYYMNTGLSIISNILTPNVATSPPLQNLPATPNTKRFAQPMVDDAEPANISEATPADKQPFQEFNSSVDKVGKNAEHEHHFATSGDAKSTQKPQAGHDGTKTATKTSTLQDAQQAQLASAQGPSIADNQSKTRLNPESHNMPKTPFAGGNKSTENKDTGEIQVSGKALVLSKNQLDQASGKELIAKSLTPDTKTNSIGENKTVANNMGTSDDQKPFLSNNSSPLADGKPANSLPQFVGTHPGKSATLIEKSTDNKIDAGQHTSTDATQLSQLSNGSGKENSGNYSDNLTIKNVNAEQLQVSTYQMKDQGNSSSNNSSNPDFKQIFSANNAQSSVTEQPQGTTSVGKAANTALPGDASANVSKQIQESVYSSLRQGQQQITIRLNPPELGRVTIKFQEQEHQIIGLLEVNRAQTRAEIQQALPEIIQNLQGLGIQIKRIDVVPTNEQEQQAFKDPSLAGEHSNETDQRNPDSPDAHENYPGWTEPNDWSANFEGYTGHTKSPVEIINDSINLLA